MTWQAGAILILVAILVGGFAWYERSRPASRVIALVAVLAALAVAGRVALAPIPNVVATTDIALLAGYSLGAGPGFAVGALAALVSNFWLGQGPWTLWQMIAWGGVAVGGAALARVSARRLGRIGLAVAAGLAGLAYGAFLDLSVMLNFGGEQSLDRYLALSARGLPFNVAHALGNAALMLAAGPALVAMLARFRERAEFRWADHRGAALDAGPDDLPPAGSGGSGRSGGSSGSGGSGASSGRSGARTAGAAGALILCVALIAAGSPSDAGATVKDGARWLERAQNEDGGFGATPTQASNVAMTGWASLGLEASKRNPFDVGTGPNPVRYLRQNAGELGSTGDLERTMLVLAGAGADPRVLGGRDIFRALAERRRRNGSWEGQVNLTAFGVLALRAAGRAESQVRAPRRWLRSAQNEDGGWGSRSDSVSEPDSSGAVLQALAVAPGNGGRGAIKRGSQYLAGAQEPDGGWALTLGAGSNSQSTAWAVQGLEAAGVNPGRVQQNGNSGFDYLEARQAPNGHYRYARGSDQTPVWVTAQALLALERQPFPIGPVARQAPEEGAAQSEEQAPEGDVKGAGGAGAGQDNDGGKENGRDKAVPDGSGGKKGKGGRNGEGGEDGKGGSNGGGQGGESAGDQAGADRSPGGSRQAARLQRASSDTDDTLRQLGLSAIAVIAAGLIAGIFRHRRRSS